ncbi:hypothetical protein Cgig2_027341 [Carnegiea gigantea]|uniref:Uncharacterized protein n=1 Tax=Carnegiea gigantea TaxID=171969 RepID=A0A9Q1GL10_9CARY|nr:hypothetical protein Cgig2_027341 [Carnegiea gigantea]
MNQPPDPPVLSLVLLPQLFYAAQILQFHSRSFIFEDISFMTSPSAYNYSVLLKTQFCKLLPVPSSSVRGGLKTSWCSSGIIVPGSGKPKRLLARIDLFKVLLQFVKKIMMPNGCRGSMFTFSASITLQKPRCKLDHCLTQQSVVFDGWHVRCKVAQFLTQWSVVSYLW